MQRLHNDLSFRGATIDVVGNIPLTSVRAEESAPLVFRGSLTALAHQGSPSKIRDSRSRGTKHDLKYIQLPSRSKTVQGRCNSFVRFNPN